MANNNNNNWRSKVNAMMTDPNYAKKMAAAVDTTRKVNTDLMNKSAEDYPALSVGQQTKSPLDLARVPEMQQEQAARATMGSNDEDYSGVVDLATKLYDEERTKRANKAADEMRDANTGLKSEWDVTLENLGKLKSAADISKTYEAIISNPSLQGAVRLNANKALVKALEANPSMTQEEQQKLYNSTIDKQLQKMGEGIDKYLRVKNEVSGTSEYLIRSAANNSAFGKAMQLVAKNMGGSEGESAYQQQALADYDANKAKWWEQGLGIAGGLVLDAPLMQGIGSAANATMGRATMWGLGKAGGKALQASTVGRIATGAAVSSGTLGGYNAVSALQSQLMGGYFDPSEIASSADHGFMLGALTGAMSPWLRGVSAGMGKVGKVATMTGGLATEAGIFTASELSEMENPYDIETIAKVFGKNVAVIGGLKVSNLPKTVKEYKQWYTEGKQSNFTDADYKTMADFAKANGYAADDAFTMSADGAYSRSIADRVTGNRTLLTMTKLQGGKEQNLAIEMYNNPSVPLSLKTKIAAKMNLPAPPPVLPNGVRVEGNKAITYYTMSNGQQQVIDIKEFDRPRKARAYANEFSRTTARRNDLLQSEASVNVMMSQPMVVARLNEQAKRYGTTLADEKARMDGILQRAADGTITQEDIAYYRSIVEDDVTTTESLKKDIKDKFGVEIDEVLNKEGNFTTAEDEALTAYGNALRGIIERGNPTTERTATAAMAGIEDYVALNNLGIEQTSAILANPGQRAAIEQQTRSHYAAWLKFFDGRMSEDALAQKLGLDLNNTSDLQTFLAEQTYFKAKAADRIAYNTAEAAKQLLERGDGGVRFLDDGRVKLKGVPFAVEVDESIAARYEAAKQGSGEPLQRIANDALKDIIKQSETPAEPKEPIAEETPIVEEPMTEAEAITQQMVDARLAEIDTDLQGIDADGVQRMTINGKPVAIVKGRIVADENGQVDKTKSSAEVAYMLLDENGRPMLNEQGKPIIEIGVKPSNVHVEDIEQWRSVDDYKASEEQRIRENNRITDEAMRQVDEQTAIENQVPTEPKTADDLLAMCDGDKALALDVATDELAKAMQAKGKGATPAETIEINKRIRMYQQMVDRLSATEQPDAATLPEAEQTAAKAEPQITEDMEFIYQQGLDENHEGMEPMQMADGRYKWVGLQRGELTANMGERDVELLDGLAKKLGVAVIPINVKDRAVNGYYKDGNIYVNTNRGAEWTMRWVAGHEMLHDVAKKSPEAYDAYKQAVLDMWGSDYIESQVKQIIEDYKASGKEIDREQALTELVNDFGGDLFNSRDGLKILDNILKDQSSKGNIGFIDTIKKWWENIKEFFGVSPYANEVEKKLADAYKSAMEIMTDRMGERKVVEQQELVATGDLKDEAVVDDAIDNEGAEMSIVRDRNKIDELEGEELVPMLRTFQVLDGRLYPPMATIQAGKKVHSIAEGDWWKSDENPDLALVKIKGTRDKFYSKDDDRISKKDGQWVITIDGEDKPLSMNGKSLSYYFNLKKGEKGDVATDDLEAAYNPYIHTSKSALNDQFRGAYLRPNLVLVEVLVPKSEIDGTNRYKADYAKDGIGFVPWNEGQVIKQAVAAGHPGRDVALSRYAKIGRVFSNTEWADRIDAELAPYKDKITLPFVAFPPEVLRGLANKGYKIEPPTSKKAQPYYEKWLNGEQPTDPNGGGKPTEDAEFSIKADKELEKKSLVGVHNLTEDNLRYALNLGGLANPSTAVIDKNIMGLEGFGDISLIMPKSLVAKSTGKNAGTFAGDAYTPRFPKGDVVKYITKEGEKAIRADYPGDDKFSKDFREAWQSYGNEYGGITPTLYYMYKLENGGAKIVKAEAPKIKSKEHQRMIDKFGNKEWYELNDAEKQELVDYRKSEMIESLKGADKNMVDKVVNDFINSADPEDLAYKKLRMLKMDYKEQQRAGEVDYMATYRNAQDDVALAGEQDKFNKWLADKSKRYGIEDRIFRGYTASGNRRYAPMTLANISKVMKEQGRAGAETFMTKSAYSLRGKMLPVYKTLEQIKKNKSKLADTETYEKFRKEIGDEYNELILDISELPNVKYDDTHYILEDALLKGFDYAEKQAGIQISKAVRERISAFGNLLKEAPVKYFETKFERPVMFNEFVAAIVPKDINPELRKALTDNGLAVEEYDRGDEASRLEAIRKASDRDDVQFSVKGKRADESVLDYAKRMNEEGATSAIGDTDYSIVRNGKEYKNDGYTQRGNINLSRRANEAIEDGMTDIGKDNEFGRFIAENGLGEYDGEYHHVGQKFNTHYFARLNDGVTLASARKAYKKYLENKSNKEVADVLKKYPDAIAMDGGTYRDYKEVAYAGGKFWFVPRGENEPRPTIYRELPQGDDVQFSIKGGNTPERRTDEVERLKKKISELKADNTKTASDDKAKVREIADEMHAYIKKNIPTEVQSDMTRNQFKGILNQLENAITKQDLEKPMQMVEYIGANVARRALTRQMRDFVKNGFKTLTPKGLAKPKTVDGVTSRVLGLVKTLYQSMNKNAFGSDLYKLQKQVREEKAKLEQFNAGNGGKYQDVVDKVNEVLGKTGVDRYEELYKYFDEKQAAGDVDGEVLGYIGRMLPLLDSIELTKDQQKQAKADSAIVTKEDLDQLRTSLEEKRDKGVLSEEDKAVLDNMPLYEAMLSLHQQQLNIDGPGALSLAMQMKAKVGEIKEYGKKLDELDNKNSKTAIAYKTRIKEANNELQELFAARIVDQKAVNANVGELLDNLKEIRDTGKSKLQEWSKAKQERATRLVKMANESFGKDAKGYWSEVDKRGKLKKDFINWANNLRLSVLMSPAMSFEYMLGVMDPRYYTNNSPIYKQFIKSSEGLIKANDNFFEGTESYNMAVNEAVERFINRNAMTNLKEYFRRGDRFATAIIPFEVKVSRNGADEYIPKEEMMTRGQAAKIYAWSRMADGMAKLKAHGVTDNTLTKVKEFIGEDYMNFIDWVEDEFFPRLRRERYNPVYKQMYGISMAENDHYFPFLIYQKDVRTEQELEVSNNDTLGGGVVGNLVERKRNNARLDFTAKSPDIFDMITDYGRKMEEWAAYAQVREDLKKVINDKQFKQHCDELGTHYYKYFLEAAQVASRLSRDMAMTQHTQSGWAKVQKTIASAAISLRVSTALKQLLSAPAFMVYSLDPAFHHELIKTVQPIDVESAIKGLWKLAEGDMGEAKKLLLSENWVGHYNWCVENLPSFRERVTLGGAGNPILEEKGFAKFADGVQSVGMLPNRLVDAFTCSVGAKAIYEYAYKKYKKNYSEKTAHNMAVTDAEIAFNSSQQSSNPVFLAPMQVSKQFLLRGMMNYKNSPIGYYRNAMKASIDMYRATKAIFGQPKFTINGEVYGFENDGKNPFAMAAESGARASMFWLFLNLIWNFGTVGVAGLSYTMLNGSKNDDGNMLYTDEEIKKALGNDMGWALFNASNQGIPWVSGFSSAAQTGQDYTPSILFSEMNNYVEQINKDGFMSMATAQIFTDLLLKNAAGVDPEVWGQIYRGAQGIMEDRPMRIEDFMNLIASPRSAISGVTKQRVGEYDRLRDYVNDRIASNRQLGVDERMTFGKKLTGMRELSKKSLGMYVDEYLADKIPGYREFANKPTEMEKEEEVANSNTLNAASSLYETIVRKEEEKDEKKDKIKDPEIKSTARLLTAAANVIHRLCEVNDFETAERIANEMERIIKRDYNPNGKTIEERLKNVDVWDSTGTTEQPSADGYNTAFERAIDGGFASYLRRGKD